MHPWIGAGTEDRRRVLEELGLTGIDDLFSQLPESIRTDGLSLPRARDEESLRHDFAALAIRNSAMDCHPCFLGAGVYRHVLPAVVDSVLSRAEFFTSYTPYQPEISQGTLQVIFEFQTLITQLTGMEIANASLYDGATALVEAALFAHRVHRGKRQRVVVAETVHPIYRSVLDTYATAQGIEVVAVPPGADGQVDMAALAEVVTETACCVAVQSPNFLGVIEDLEAVAEVAHSAGALAAQVVTEAVSMALVKAGGAWGFDVVCGEAQSFGVAPGFGGPHLGFFACREKHIRQMPGRLCGQTVDEDGQRVFCLTLSTREQHIRRAKATSNICTNQGLMALAATVWLEAIGGTGLRRMAVDNLSRSHELRRRIEALDGDWRLAYPRSAFFNEFFLVGPMSGAEMTRRMAESGVLAGVPAARWGGSWFDGVLVAVTEKNSAQDLDAFVEALGRLS